MSFEGADVNDTRITVGGGSAVDYKPVAPLESGAVTVDRFLHLAGVLRETFTAAELDVIHADLGRYAQEQSVTAVLWHVVSVAQAAGEQRRT